MSTILDQYGGPARMRFARAVNNSPFRGLVFNRRDESIHKLIPQNDRRALGALSRQVVFNTGVAKEAIRQKASWSTLDAFRPEYNGPEEEGAAAIDFLEEEWFPGMDLMGQTIDWPEWLKIISKAIDRDGESFILKTKDESDRPALLILPAYMVRSESQATIYGGRNDGVKVEDGCGIDPTTGRTVFYRVYSDRETFEDIPAESMVHLFERDFPEQRRGFPAFSHALADLLQNMESKELEILRQLVISNIFLINKGGPTPTPTTPGFQPITNAATGETILREQVAPGIQHLQTGQELEAITHQNPGDVWQKFRWGLSREAVVGAGWSYSLVSIGGGNTQGTVERAEVVRARLAVRDRVGTLCRGARAFVTYGLSGPNAPRVSKPVSGWSFTKPARVSVDDGREDRSNLEAVKAGAMSESAYQANQGRSLRDHAIQKARDRATFAEVAAEATAAGVPTTAEDLSVRSGAPDPPQEQPVITLPDD